jgi:hypothetical protein
MDTFVAPTPAIRTSRTSRILVGVIVVAIVGALALGVALAARAISVDSPMTNEPQGALAGSVSAGYPAHYGLAGPSRVGANARSWVGYPAHYGLAGPGRVLTITGPIGSGAGYPPHHGLAGPSQVDGGR